MAIVVAVEVAKSRRRAVEIKDYTQSTRPEDKFYATLYMGAAPATAEHALSAVGDRTEPQAYLVEQPPFATVPPHFHDTDQFQVFVAGEAEFGKQLIDHVCIHYAGGHTPYGPIVTKEKGAHYFTLRVAWDSGGKPMPESRSLLKRGRQCHRVAEVAPPSVARQDLLPVEADGLGAAAFTINAGETSTLDLPTPGGGQYALVLDGEVDVDGQRLGKHSCAFRFPVDEPLAVTSIGAAASVLLMQFPVQQANAS
jgi:hypothetical protein